MKDTKPTNAKPTNGKPADRRADPAQRGTQQRWGTSAAAFYFDIEGETIQVHLMTGEVLTGMVLGLDTFDLVFQQDKGACVLIPKHAIAYIEQPAK